MALPSGTYAPRDPAASVLYQVVRDHYHTFRAEASQLREGEGLPRFVVDEFDAFLRCGWHAGGFARFRCTGCRAERMVAFSCKGRGFLHALVLDGVFARAGDGQLRFHRAPAPSAADVADVLAAIAPQLRARLARAGVQDDDGAAVSAAAASGLAGLAAASVQGVLTLGGASGRRPQRLGQGERRPREQASPETPHAR